MLAAPKRIEEGELVSDLTVGTVLELMRQLFDYVIVDCGDHVDENAVAAGERSEHLFYVLNQTHRGGAMRLAIHRFVRAPRTDDTRAVLYSGIATARRIR